MAPPQSETAQRLFRALGRDPATGEKTGDVTAWVVYRQETSYAPSTYDNYTQAYNNYLDTLTNVHNAASNANAAPAPKAAKGRTSLKGRSRGRGRK